MCNKKNWKWVARISWWKLLTYFRIKIQFFLRSEDYTCNIKRVYTDDFSFPLCRSKSVVLKRPIEGHKNPRLHPDERFNLQHLVVRSAIARWKGCKLKTLPATSAVSPMFFRSSDPRQNTQLIPLLGFLIDSQDLSRILFGYRGLISVNGLAPFYVSLEIGFQFGK